MSNNKIIPTKASEQDIVLYSYIQKYKDLFWYFDTRQLDKITFSVAIEFFLNYGDMELIRGLFSDVGKEKIAQEFARATQQKRHNYHPRTQNFFHFYFKRHVPQYPFR